MRAESPACQTWLPPEAPIKLPKRTFRAPFFAAFLAKFMHDSLHLDA
jgi:hypothetical protein